MKLLAAADALATEPQGGQNKSFTTIVMMLLGTVMLQASKRAIKRENLHVKFRTAVHASINHSLLQHQHKLDFLFTQFKGTHVCPDMNVTLNIG